MPLGPAHDRDKGPGTLHDHPQVLELLDVRDPTLPAQGQDAGRAPSPDTGHPQKILLGCLVHFQRIAPGPGQGEHHLRVVVQGKVEIRSLEGQLLQREPVGPQQKFRLIQAVFPEQGGAFTVF